MRSIQLLLLLVCVVAHVGCVAMCQNSYDCYYGAYGGVRDRIDRVHGRVGSIFDPAASLDEVIRRPEEPLMAPPRPETPAEEADDVDFDDDLDDEQLRQDVLDKLRDLNDLPGIEGSGLDSQI